MAKINIQLSVDPKEAISDLSAVQKEFDKMFNQISANGGVAFNKFLANLSSVGVITKKSLKDIQSNIDKNPVKISIIANEADVAKAKKVLVDTLEEVKQKTRGFNLNALEDGAAAMDRLRDASGKMGQAARELNTNLTAKTLETFKSSIINVNTVLNSSKKAADASKASFIGLVSTLLGEPIATWSTAVEKSSVAAAGLRADVTPLIEKLDLLKKSMIEAGEAGEFGEVAKISTEIEELENSIGGLIQKIRLLEDVPKGVQAVEDSFNRLSRTAKQLQKNVNITEEIRGVTKELETLRVRSSSDFSTDAVNRLVLEYGKYSAEVREATSNTDQLSNRMKGLGTDAAQASIAGMKSEVSKLGTEIGKILQINFEKIGGKQMAASVGELFNKLGASGGISDEGVNRLFRSFIAASDGATQAVRGVQQFSEVAGRSVIEARGSAAAIGALSQNAHYLSVESLKSATNLENLRSELEGIARQCGFTDEKIAALIAAIDKLIVEAKVAAGELRTITKAMEGLELSQQKVDKLDQALKELGETAGNIDDEMDPKKIGSTYEEMARGARKAIAANKVLINSLAGVRGSTSEVGNELATSLDSSTKELETKLAKIGQQMGASLARSLKESLSSLRIDGSVSQKLGESLTSDVNRAVGRGVAEGGRSIDFASQFTSVVQDAGKAASAIENINSRIRASGSVSKLSGDEVRAFGSETTAAANAAGRSAESIIKLKSELLANAKQFGLSATQAQKYVQTLDLVQKRLGGVLAPLNSNKRALETQNKLYEQATAGLDQYATQLVSATVQNSIFVASFGALLGTIALFKDAIKSIIELQLQSARVVAVTRDVTRTNEELSHVISSELTNATVRYGTSIEQTAQILREFGSAGLDAQESLAALDSTLQAVIATEGEAGEFTRTVAGIFSVMGDEIDTTTDRLGRLTTINDTMVRAFRESQLELGELVQGFRFSSASARNVGVDFTELTALLQLLNNNLIKSGQAGRSLQTTFSQIAQKTSQFEEAFNIEIDTSQGLDFIEIVRDISEQLGNGALTAREVEEIFHLLGLEGARSFLVIVQQVEEFDRLLQDLQENAEGSAEATANIRLDTIRGQLDILRQKALEFFRALVTPLLGENFKNFQSIIEGLSAAIEGLTQFLRTGFGQALSFVVTGLTSLIFALTSARVIFLAFAEAGKLVKIALLSKAVFSRKATAAIIQEAEATAAAAAVEKFAAITKLKANTEAYNAVAALLAESAAKKAAATATAELAAANKALIASYAIMIAAVAIIATIMIAAAVSSKDASEKFQEAISDLRSQEIEINEVVSAYSRLGDKLEEVANRQKTVGRSERDFGQDIRDALEQYGGALDVANQALNQNNEGLARSIELLQQRIALEEQSALIEQNRIQQRTGALQNVERSRIRDLEITRGDVFEGGGFEGTVSRFFSGGRTGRSIINRGAEEGILPDVSAQISRAQREFDTFADNFGSQLVERIRNSGIDEELSTITSNLIDSGATAEEVTRAQSEYFASLGFNLENSIALSQQLLQSGGLQEFQIQLQRALTESGRAPRELNELVRAFALVESGVLSLVQATDESFEGLDFRLNEFGQRIAELSGQRTFLDAQFFETQEIGLGFDNLAEGPIQNFADSVASANEAVIAISGGVSDYISNLDDFATNSGSNTIFEALLGTDGLTQSMRRFDDFLTGQFAQILDSEGLRAMFNEFSAFGGEIDLFGSLIDTEQFDRVSDDLSNAFNRLIDTSGTEYERARDEFERLIALSIVPVEDLSEVESQLFEERARSIVNYVFEGISEAEALRDEALNSMVRDFNSNQLPNLIGNLFSSVDRIGIDRSDFIRDTLGGMLTDEQGFTNQQVVQFAQGIESSLREQGVSVSLPIDFAAQVDDAMLQDMATVRDLVFDTLFAGGDSAVEEQILALQDSAVRNSTQRFESEQEVTGAILQRLESVYLEKVTQEAIGDQLQLQIDLANNVARVSLNQLTNLRNQREQLGYQLQLMNSVYDVALRQERLDQLRVKLSQLTNPTTEEELALRETLLAEFNRLNQEQEEYNALIAQRRLLTLQDIQLSHQAANEFAETIVSGQQLIAEFGGQAVEYATELRNLSSEYNRNLELLVASEANNTEYLILSLQYAEETINLVDEYYNRLVEVEDIRRRELDTLARITTGDSERVNQAIALRDASAEIIDIQSEIDFLNNLGIDATDRLVELQRDLRDAQLDSVTAQREMAILDAQRIDNLEEQVQVVDLMSGSIENILARTAELFSGTLELTIDEDPLRNSINLARQFGIDLRRGFPEDLISEIADTIREIPDAYQGSDDALISLINTTLRYEELQQRLLDRQRDLTFAQIEAARASADLLFQAGDFDGSLGQLSEIANLTSQIAETAPESSIQLIEALEQDFARVQQAMTSRIGQENLTADVMTEGLFNNVNVVSDFTDALAVNGAGLTAYEALIEESRNSLLAFFQTYQAGLEAISSSDWDNIINPVNELRDSIGDLTRAIFGLDSLGFDLQDGRVRQGNPERRSGGGVIGMGMNRGGKVPGTGVGDIVPALLEPGEFVVPKHIAQLLGFDVLEALRSGDFGLLSVLMRGRVPGFKNGGIVGYQAGGKVAPQGSGAIYFDIVGQIREGLSDLVTMFSDRSVSISDSIESVIAYVSTLTGQGLGQVDIETISENARRETIEYQESVRRMEQVRPAVQSIVDRAVEELGKILEDFGRSFSARMRAAFNLNVIESLRNSFKTVFDEIKRGGSSVLSFLNVAFEQIDDSATDAEDANKRANENSREDLLTMLRRNEISYFEYLNRLEDLLSQFNADQNDALQDSIDESLKKWEGYVDSVAEVFRTVGERLGDSASEGLNRSLDRIFQTIGDGLNNAIASNIGNLIGSGSITDRLAKSFDSKSINLGDGPNVRERFRQRREERQIRRAKRASNVDEEGNPAETAGKRFVDYLIERGKDLAGAFGDFLKFSWQNAAQAGLMIGQAAIAVGGVLVKFASASDTQFASFIENIENLPAAIEEVSTRLAENLPALAESIAANAPVIIDSLVDALPKVIDALIAALPTVILALAQAIGEVVPAIIKEIPKIAFALVDIVTTLLPELGKLLGDVIASVASIIDDLVVGIVQAVPKIIEGLVGFVEGFISSLPDIVENLLFSVFNAIPRILESVFTKLIPGIFKSLWRLLVQFLYELPKAIIKGIGQLFKNSANKVGNFFAEVFTLGFFKPKKKRHRGGTVGNLSDIEELQASFGTKKDEISALLQTGEGVLSRKGMSALGGTAFLDMLNSGIPLGEMIRSASMGVGNTAIVTPFSMPRTFSDKFAQAPQSQQIDSSINTPITVNVTMNGAVTEDQATMAADVISKELMAKFVDAIQNKKDPALNAALRGFLKDNK